MRIGKFLQHEVASGARAVRVFARIVIRRTLDQSNQQREFTDVELCERLGEVVLAAESETMYRALAVLAQIDLIEIRDQDVFVGKVRLEPQRHHSLGGLAGDGLL